MSHHVPSISFIQLSDDTIIDNILADIPFFTVGVLAFCTLSFFVAMKRLNLLSAYLHASILAAFIASILDICLMLSLNPSSGSITNVASSVIVAREIGLTISLGFRLFFFWTYVAEPPRPEASLLLTPKDLHSGAWNRWGSVGSCLRFSTLVMIFVAFVLQLVWRLSKDSTDFASVYHSDAVVEIVLATVFLLKLGLNTCLCTVVPKWKVVLSYSGFFLALAFTFGIGLGNIVSLEFTDSILGRFLQALQFYIMVLSILLATFYPNAVSEANTSDEKHTSSYILPLCRPESPLRVAPPQFSAPSPPPLAVLGPFADLQNIPSNRGPATSRVASWITKNQRMSGRLRTPPQNDRARPWSYSEAERSESITESMTVDTTRATDERTRGTVSPAFTDYVSVDNPTSMERGNQVVELHNRSTNTTPSSRYSSAPPTFPPPFGLYGAVSHTGLPPLVTAAHSRPLSTTTDGKSPALSDLFRQQTELDKSIAALRLFEHKGGSSQDEGKREENASPSSLYYESDRSRTSQLLSSEMSLGHFPPPSWEKDAEMSEDNFILQSSRRDNTTRGVSFLVNNVPMDLVPPQMPAAVAERGRSSSETDSELLMTSRAHKFDSLGTRYDVTSFIGNLTTPGHISSSSIFTGITSEGETPSIIITLDQPDSTSTPPPLNKAGQVLYQVDGYDSVDGSTVAVPQAPRRMISNPKLKEDADVTMSGAFESPRPAPLVLHHQIIKSFLV